MVISPMPFRVLSFGAGAIGTYIGGSLALAGHKVVFYERPEAAARVREQGITLQLGDLSRRVADFQVADTLTDCLTQGPYDIALLAVKSYDTEGIMQSIRPYVAALPPILCLQNGVENEKMLANTVGESRVIAGTVTSAVGRRDAGDVVLEKFRGIGVASGHPLAAGLVAAMNSAGLNARLYPDAASLKWSKMLTNLMANASSAILGMAPAEIYAHPGLFSLEIDQMREALAVMGKMKIPVTDLPGTPVRVLAALVRYLPASWLRPLLSRALSQGRGAKMPSFYLDLVGGRGKSEVTYLNGAVTRFGSRLGVFTPVNQVYTEVLAALTCGGMARADFDHQPGALITLVQQARRQ